LKYVVSVMFWVLLVLNATAQTPAITALDPSSGVSGGGTEVVIHGSNLLTKVSCVLPCPPLVAFGDIVVPAREEYENRLVVVTPAHKPGTVDVTVTVTGESPVTAPQAFTFLPDADDAYGQILLPIHLDGIVHGAHGTQWRTDLWLRNNGSKPVSLAPWPCPGGQPCPAEFPLIFTLAPGKSLHNLPPFFQASQPNPSRILYVRDAEGVDLSFGLRFADISRSSLNAGTGLPVIRESELLGSTTHLLNVPATPEFRIMLRVYDLAYTSSLFRVTLFAQSEDAGDLLASTQMAVSTNASGEFRTTAAYAQLDVSSLITAGGPEAIRIQIEPLTPGSRYWTVASITNNETQLVTVVTPE
jgi:hypothetical protein